MVTVELDLCHGFEYGCGLRRLSCDCVGMIRIRQCFDFGCWFLIGMKLLFLVLVWMRVKLNFWSEKCLLGFDEL